MALFGKRSIAGVEIDSFEVRAVELGGSLGSPVLMTAGRAALPAGAVKDGKILKPELVGGALTRLWADAGIKARDVILGVSNQDLLLRFAFFPKVPPDKVHNMIKFQAQDFLPLPVNDVELDYMILGEASGERGAMLHVLLVAARKTMINDYIGAIRSANLNVLDIDASNLALMRLLPGNERSSTAAMINLTGEQAGMIILRNSIPGLARIAMISSYNKAPAALSVEAGDAYGQAAAAAESNTDSTPAQLLNPAVLAEIKSSIGYYQNQTQNVLVDRVFLCGNIGGKKGLATEMQESLGVRVEVLNPLRSIAKGGSGKRIPDSEAADYAICISLAMRGLEGGK